MFLTVLQVSTVISWCFEGFWRCPLLFLGVLKGFGGVHAYFLVFWRVLEVSTVISWCFEGLWGCPYSFLGVLVCFGSVHGYLLVF